MEARSIWVHSAEMRASHARAALTPNGDVFVRVKRHGIVNDLQVVGRKMSSNTCRA